MTGIKLALVIIGTLIGALCVSYGFPIYFLTDWEVSQPATFFFWLGIFGLAILFSVAIVTTGPALISRLNFNKKTLKKR